MSTSPQPRPASSKRKATFCQIGKEEVDRNGLECVLATGMSLKLEAMLYYLRFTYTVV
ncbi:hypothetical protein KIN20_006231 [Parelaphostrongylus tenuis]|uniref:Uncharacterized protein n=1 Tax=Parelaphostrongylus tenuis TaxID=148309 RepID=A0AAD5QKT9_PARTN|nr:hypothetical protein KIN20_006231 [Parelaphostrongylus tenuis]